MILKSLLLVLISLAFTYPVSAQVIPDNSLGSEGSTVTPNVTVKDAIADFIEGGAVRGNNLFHSFSEFNVGNGGSVYFANPDGVTNILNRVTGNNASKIFGTLGVDGGANLFLLNPNGILFGENAALDVSGSFMATTADSYLFDNDLEYSASNPEVPPMLTIDLPIGVQLGTNPGKIVVQGSGHNLGIDFLTFTPIRDNRPVGLEVESNNTLMLLGGEVNLAGGNLTSQQGNVEIGSVAATETVGLNSTNNGFTLDYGEVSSFADINLTEFASIDVSGSGGGSIQIYGKNIAVAEKSAIIANTLGADAGGDVSFVASESVRVIDAENVFPSSILVQIEPGATGDGGNLTIDAKELEISASVISASTSGGGNSGDLTVNAESIKVREASSLGIFTGLFNSVNSPFATGNGGNLTVNSDRIVMEGGGQVGTGTFGVGDSGDLIVDVGTIEVRGISPQGSSSGLFSSVMIPEAIGDGGNLTINSNRIVLEDGGQIVSGTFGMGNSGDLTVNAESIEVKGVVGSNISGFSSTVLAPEATGDGGNLTINSNRIVLEDGGQIISGTVGAGNSGDLTVNAESIEVKGVAEGQISGFYSTVLTPEATGNGGNLTVNSNSIVLEDGGLIGAGTFGAGNSGDLNVNAESIEVKGVVESNIISSLFSTVLAPEATGDGGNLTVNSNSIVLEDGGIIGAGTLGTGNSGDLTVDAESIEIRGVTSQGEPSGLLSSVISEATGDGGDLTVNSNSIVLEDGGRIASGTLGAGNSGDLTVNAESIEVRGNSPQGIHSGLFSSIASPEATGDGGNLTVNSDRLILENGGQIGSGTAGASNSGDLSVNAGTIEVKGVSPLSPSTLFSSVTFPSATGDGGDLMVVSDRLILEDGGQITSGTSGIGNSGDLSIEVSESITIDGINSFSNILQGDRIAASGLSASVESTGTGDGGDLTVKTPQLHITNGGQIGVSTSGRGNGGNLTIESNDLHLLGGGQISASSFGMADAGNINIQGNDITVSGVLTDELALDIQPESFPSSISAFSQGEFAAGSITIESNNLNLSDRGNISVSNLDTGNSGNLYITANELNLDRSAIIEARVNAGDRGNINLTTENITSNNQSQITVQATGTATGGNITIDNSNLILARNNSDIKANAEFGSGGNISIFTELIFTDLTSDLDASSEFGLDGVVEIKSPDSQKELGEVVLPEKIEDPTGLITAACPSSEENTLAVTGNGGIPNSPYQTQSIDTTWNDLRPVQQKEDEIAALPRPLKEATTTMIDANGELELVALTPLSTHRWINSNCSN